MPSKTAKRLIGEADLPKPADMFRQANPSRGAEQGIKWKLHKTVGIAPTNIDPGLYEDWLQQVMEDNVDAEWSPNEFDADSLRILTKANTDPAFVALCRQAEQIMRHTGADRVAFTTVEGVE